MDYSVCNIIYVDREGGESRIFKRNDISEQSFLGGAPHSERTSLGSVSESTTSLSRVEHNVRTLLKTFHQVQLFQYGKPLMQKLADLNDLAQVDATPTLILIDVPDSDHWDELRASARTPSPMSTRQLSIDPPKPDDPAEKFYGTALLQWITSDIQQNQLSRLFVPIVLCSTPIHSGRQVDKDSRASNIISLDQKRTMKLIDHGAIDVCPNPIPEARVPGLAVHAYRAHKDIMKEHSATMEQKRGRKRSWVGLDDQKPYAYLREAMVAGLMDGICRLEPDDTPYDQRTIDIDPDRKHLVKQAVSTWHFSAHDFTDDELLYAAIVMLEHALSMSELEQWRISTESLTGFLIACRSAYNDFVPYHNFRHVIDVLQACFHFLVRTGTLSSYQSIPQTTSTSTNPSSSPIAALLKPFDALTLLITAIGHDVGHPGVNNAFLIKLNAPLAQLYNDRSVLESFHCAAYSQILRRHWPSAFAAVEMRQLMISSILATDMGLHFDYMKKLGFLEEKLHENKGTDGWNGRTKEEYRTLACSLLIKCADISNVARRYDVAAKWTMILTDEFARQASMERDLSIPSALFAPPVREIIELGQSQIGFMNMFAIPLFSNVTNVIPEMQFCVDELQKNRKIWEERIEYEQKKKRLESDGVKDSKLASQRQPSVVSPMTKRKSSTMMDPVPPMPQLDRHRGSVAFMKSPLGNPDANVPDGNFSTFRALTDIPSKEESEQPSTYAGSLLPPEYAFPDRSSPPLKYSDGGPQLENHAVPDNRSLSDPTTNKSTVMEEQGPSSGDGSHILGDATNMMKPSSSLERQVGHETELRNTSKPNDKEPRLLSTIVTNESHPNDAGTSAETPDSANSRNSPGTFVTLNSSDSSSYPVSAPRGNVIEKSNPVVPATLGGLPVSVKGESNGGAVSEYNDGRNLSPGKLEKKSSRSRFIRFFKKKGSHSSDNCGAVTEQGSPRASSREGDGF